MSEPAVRPAPAQARTGGHLWAPALFVTGILALAFHLRGAGVPVLWRCGRGGPGRVAAAGAGCGAGLAAPVAVPDHTGRPGRRPIGRPAAGEGFQARTRLASHGLHGAAEPDLLRCALVA